MKALDLFCCCGGTSKGIADAGFEVIGVDITDNHQYPFDFIHSDVFDLPLEFFDKFDFIWASPPCQHYIPTNKWRGNQYPDLIPKTRDLLEKVGKPFIIENVIGAPIRKDVMLCGEMFGLRVIRHRLFETHDFTVLQPKHMKHKLSVIDGTAIAVYSGGVNPGFWGDKQKQIEFRKKRKDSYYACVAGHGGNGYSFKLDDWQKGMGIDWITDKKHLTQAIPPAYSKYLAGFAILLLQHSESPSILID